MKKLAFIYLFIFVLFSCSTFPAKENTSDKRTGNSNISDDTEIVKKGWTFYSYGLYYKNAALLERKREQRNNLLKSAIEYFMKALSFGESLDRVYLQLSDCYYYLNNYEESLTWAKKSLKLNKKQFGTYKRIFYIYNVLRNYRKAAGIYEDYLKIFPNSIYIEYVLAEHYFKRLRDYKRAVRAFKKIITISERTSAEDYYRENAFLSLGYISYKKRKYDESIKYFLLARDINPENRNSAYMLAILYMNKYDIDNAEKYAGMYLKSFPGNILMHSIMGRIKYLKRESDVIRHFRYVRKSKTIDGLLARGLNYELINKDKEAEVFLKTVLRYKPNLLSSHVALARVYIRKNNRKAALNEFITAGVIAYKKDLFDIARENFTHAIRLNNKIPDLYYYLGRVYEEKKKLSMAILNYQKVMELKPNIDILLHIGYLHGLKGDRERSFFYFDKAIEMEPANSKPYFYKGLGFMRGSNYSNAEENIKKAIELEDKLERYYFYLAVVQEKQNKFNEAVKSLEKAIESDPKSARAYNYLGYLYAERNIKINRSLYLIKKALEIEPDNGAYLDSLGWVYYRQGKFKLALEKLLKAEKVLRLSNSPDPVVYDHIGDAYKKIGNLNMAIDYWKKSVKIMKNSDIEMKIKKYYKKRDREGK